MAGSNEALGGGGFHHVAVRVPDFAAGKKFYEEVLGFREKVTWGEGEKQVALLDTGDGNYLELFAGGAAERKPEGAMLHVAFRTNDVDGVIARARQHGAEVTVEPKDVTLQSRPFQVPARIAFFRGPAGELVELFRNELT